MRGGCSGPPPPLAAGLGLRTGGPGAAAGTAFPPPPPPRRAGSFPLPVSTGAPPAGPQPRRGGGAAGGSGAAPGQAPLRGARCRTGEEKVGGSRRCPVWAGAAGGWGDAPVGVGTTRKTPHGFYYFILF